jgi:hypothetical protein
LPQKYSTTFGGRFVNTVFHVLFPKYVRSETQTKGRPQHCQRKTNTQQSDKENQDSWQPEQTAFGCIGRRPNGEVLLPPGAFGELIADSETLSKMC